MKSRDRTRDGNFEKSHSTVTKQHEQTHLHSALRHAAHSIIMERERTKKQRIIKRHQNEILAVMRKYSFSNARAADSYLRVWCESCALCAMYKCLCDADVLYIRKTFYNLCVATYTNRHTHVCTPDFVHVHKHTSEMFVWCRLQAPVRYVYAAPFVCWIRSKQESDEKSANKNGNDRWQNQINGTTALASSTI